MINKIYVIESIPKDEPQTGEELYNDTISRYNLLHNSEIENYYIKVNSKKELITVLENILSNAINTDEIIIHIEAHGNEVEMGLSNDERITWDEFTDYLIPINQKTVNKLHLNLATCFSMHNGLSIDLKKIAPYKSYISTLGKVNPVEIINDNTSLYENIMKTKDMYKAYVNFDKVNPKTKFRIKDIETVLDTHLVPTLVQFVHTGSDFIVKSFFDPYLNIQIDINEMQNSQNKAEYILKIWKSRFYP